MLDLRKTSSYTAQFVLDLVRYPNDSFSHDAAKIVSSGSGKAPTKYVYDFMESIENYSK